MTVVVSGGRGRGRGRGRVAMRQPATLSEKFSQLAHTTNTTVVRDNRRQGVFDQQRGKRSDAINSRRNIPQSTGGPGRGGKGQGRGGRGGRGRRGGRGGGKKEGGGKAPTGADLDMEMDQYWFKAGKGPDPVKSALDRDMDDYFKVKETKAAAEAAAAATSTAPAETVEMSA